MLDIEMPFNGEILTRKDFDTLKLFSVNWFDPPIDDVLKLKNRYYAWNISPYLLNNIGWILIWLIIDIAVGVIVWAVNKIIISANLLIIVDKPNLNPAERRHNFFIKMFLILRDWIVWKFTFIFILMHFAIISFYTWVNLIYPNLGSGRGVFNFIAALFLKSL